MPDKNKTEKTHSNKKSSNRKSSSTKSSSKSASSKSASSKKSSSKRSSSEKRSRRRSSSKRSSERKIARKLAREKAARDKKMNKISAKISNYLVLMRVDKPIGTLLLLWPTLWALWVVSDGQPSAKYLWIFTLGVIVMRSAGCVINDYADREYDPLVKRTNQRPIAAGFVKPREALYLFVGLSCIGLILLVMLPTRVWPWSILAIGLTIIYPFMKRFFQAPQLVLSVAFSVSMLMVYVTYDKPFDSILSVMFVMNLVWVMVFDTQYAMSDRDDDLLVGVKSTAILFGERDKLIIAVLQAIVIVLLIVLMQLLHLPISFLISIALVASLFLYQQWLIRKRERLACFDAFLNNAWVGGVIWFGLLGAL